MAQVPRTGEQIPVVWPHRISRAVKGSVLVGYGLAVAAFVIALAGSDLSFGKAFLDPLVLLMLSAVPPTAAILSYPKRPSMLLPAALMGFVGLLGILSIFGYALAALSAIWLWAYLKLGPDGKWLNKLAMVIVPLLWLVASATLWAYLDPVCEQRLRDGTVVEIDPATRGFESGWSWEVGSSFSGSSGPLSDDVVLEACSSNTLVPWEALLALALCAGAVLVAFTLAGGLALPKPTRPADL